MLSESIAIPHKFICWKRGTNYYFKVQTEIMKKLLFITTAFLFSGSLVRAQQVPPGSVQQIDSLRNNGSAKVDTTSLVKVKANAIPTALRSTLKASDYSGWEKGMLYKDPKTNGYLLQLSPNTAGTKKNPNWFKFDSKGKRIPDLQIKK